MTAMARTTPTEKKCYCLTSEFYIYLHVCLSVLKLTHSEYAADAVSSKKELYEKLATVGSVVKKLAN